MARRIISLDERIEKAETAMLAAKAKYEKALDEMEKLVEKRKKQNDKKYLMPTMLATRPLRKSLHLFSLTSKNPSEC